MIKKRMNKKGFLGDIFSYILVLFTMGIVIIACWILLDNFNTAWQADPSIPTISKQIVAKQQTKFVPIWDANMVVWAVGYIIAIIITAFALRSHPVFAMLAVVVLIVLGLVAVNLSNSFFTFASSTTISGYASPFTKLVFLQNNLPIFVIGLGILFVIILYAKTKNQIPAL